MPIMSERVFPKAAAAWKTDIDNRKIKLKTYHCGNAKLSSECKINVLPRNDHDEVVEEAKADEGKGVVISQLFQFSHSWFVWTWLSRINLQIKDWGMLSGMNWKPFSAPSGIFFVLQHWVSLSSWQLVLLRNLDLEWYSVKFFWWKVKSQAAEQCYQAVLEYPSSIGICIHQ